MYERYTPGVRGISLLGAGRCRVGIHIWVPWVLDEIVNISVGWLGIKGF